MSLSFEEVEHVARLARLSLTDSEKDIYRSQLEHILEYIGKLSEVDTSKVEPTSHVIPLSNVTREDETVESKYADAILDNAPAAEERCFKVKKVIE